MPHPPAKSTKSITHHVHSPGQMMDFYAALKCVHNGGVVTRESWDNDGLHIRMYKGQLCIRLEDGLNHPLIVSQEDLDGDDWMMVTLANVPKIPGDVQPMPTPKFDIVPGIDPRDKLGIDQ